jgi:hypothetical protein
MYILILLFAMKGTSDSDIQEEKETQEQLPAAEGSVYKTFKFEHNCKEYQFTLQMYKSYYDFYENRPNIGAETTTLYYTKYFNQTTDESMMQQVIDQILQVTGTDDPVPAIASLVQNMEYDCDKLVSYENINQSGYKLQYPYETLYSKEGVCGDLAILMAKLLKQAGYGTILFTFKEANHLALGIACPMQYSDYNSGYCYIEATAPSRIGLKPEIMSGKNFTENPEWSAMVSEGKVYEIASVKAQQKIQSKDYGNYLLQLGKCSDIEMFKKVHKASSDSTNCNIRLDENRAELEALRNDLNDENYQYDTYGCSSPSPNMDHYNKCMAWYNRLNDQTADYNAAGAEFNVEYDKCVKLYNDYEKAQNTFDITMNSRSGCPVVVLPSYKTESGTEEPEKGEIENSETPEPATT